MTKKPQTEHVCQLFDSNETRAETVAAFLAEGLRAGECVVVAVRPLHWKSVVARLGKLGLSVDTEVAEGRLIVKDAFTTLAQLTPRGRLNPFAFNETVGAAVRELSRRGRVRAYGEMVDILIERGDLDEALELEELWNQAGEMVSLSLLCSYTAAHFVPPSTHRSLRDLCLAHTDVRRNPLDTLGDWILTTAHHPGGSSLSH